MIERYLAQDYRNMATMFYGAPPEWQALVDELRSAVNRPETEGLTPEHTTRFVPEVEHR